MKRTPFWYEDVNILTKRLEQFWATPEMTIEEKLNAMSRFVIYASFLLTFAKKDTDYLMYGFVCLVLIGFMWKRGAPAEIKKLLIPRHNFPKKTQFIKEKETCTKPTSDNPFGNVLMNEYNGSYRPPACPYDEVKEQINDKFFDNIVREPYDVYNKRHNQRHFFTTANTQIPNNQTAFAEFAYGTGPTCKEKGIECTGY